LGERDGLGRRWSRTRVVVRLPRRLRASLAPTAPRHPPPSVPNPYALIINGHLAHWLRKEEGRVEGHGADDVEDPLGKAVRRGGRGALLFGTIARADDSRLARTRCRICKEF
jgi:hypothetical protein